MTNSDWRDRAKTPPQHERSRPRALLATLRIRSLLHTAVAETVTRFEARRWQS